MAVLKGYHVDRWAYNCFVAVSCPEPYCRANKGWPCTSKTGNPSSTAHASRWAKFREFVADDSR
jgi:hypothetical protein